jgi:hypothetical protein
MLSRLPRKSSHSRHECDLHVSVGRTVHLPATLLLRLTGRCNGCEPWDEARLVDVDPSFAFGSSESLSRHISESSFKRQHSLIQANSSILRRLFRMPYWFETPHT